MDDAESTSITISVQLLHFIIALVGWSSSSLRRPNELPKMRNLVKNAKYRYIFDEDKSRTAKIQVISSETKVSRQRINEMEGFSHSLSLNSSFTYKHFVSTFLEKWTKLANLNYFLWITEAMIRGLTRLSWERVDVDFSKSIQGLLSAHTTIQASNGHHFNDCLTQLHVLLLEKPKLIETSKTIYALVSLCIRLKLTASTLTEPAWFNIWLTTSNYNDSCRSKGNLQRDDQINLSFSGRRRSKMVEVLHWSSS